MFIISTSFQSMNNLYLFFSKQKYLFFAVHNNVETQTLSKKRKSADNRQRLSQKRQRKSLVVDALESFEMACTSTKPTISRHHDIAVQTDFPDGNFCSLI